MVRRMERTAARKALTGGRTSKNYSTRAGDMVQMRMKKEGEGGLTVQMTGLKKGIDHTWPMALVIDPTPESYIFW
jgi:hypothetical protein